VAQDSCAVRPWPIKVERRQASRYFGIDNIVAMTFWYRQCRPRSQATDHRKCCDVLRIVQFPSCPRPCFLCRTGQYSTGKSALKALLHHPLPRIILQYRSLSARVHEMYERIRDAGTAAAPASGRAAASADAAAAASGLVRLRPTWLQTHTRSGRLSIDGVPLQNVSNGIEYKLHDTVAALQHGEQTHDFSDDEELGSDDAADDAGAAEEAQAHAVAATAAASAAPTAAAPGGAQCGPEPSAADKHKPTTQPEQQQQQVALRFASVRCAFVASPGCVILGADYCQVLSVGIPCTIIAQLSTVDSWQNIVMSSAVHWCGHCLVVVTTTSLAHRVLHDMPSFMQPSSLPIAQYRRQAYNQQY